MRSIFRALLEQSQRCVICMSVGAEIGLCASCQIFLPYRTLSCSRCGSLLRDKILCDCHDKSFSFDSVHSVFIYQSPISDWIQAVKYRQDMTKAKVLSHLMDPYVARGEGWIVPVPLSPQKERKRGFNQSHLLLPPALKQYKKLVKAKWLRRIKDTLAQTGLNRCQRRYNCKGAFIASSDVKGQHIILYDDVFTTGATVEAAAKACKEQGAKKVSVITIANGAA